MSIITKEDPGGNRDKLPGMNLFSWETPPDPKTATAELSGFLASAAPMETTTQAATPEAKAFIARLTALVMDFEDLDRERARGAVERQKVSDATCSVVGGVLRAWARDPARPVALSRRNEKLGGIPGGRTAALSVVDILVEVGKLADKPGVRWMNDYGFATEQKGNVSRVWPTMDLLNLATEFGLAGEAINDVFPAPQPRDPPTIKELVQIKAIKERGQKQAKPLPIETLPEASQLLTVIGHWNDFAATFSVEGCRPPRWSRAFGPNIALGGRWTAAGSPNYQNLNGDERLCLRIDGQSVVEADIQAAHLSIMHGLLGLPLPDHDLYEIGTETRGAVKAWIVATLGKGSPVARWANDAPALARAHNAKRLGEAIIQRYPFLRNPTEAVAEAAGLNHLAAQLSVPPRRLLTHRLMGIEARAITRAMLDLRNRLGVLSLPVHDSLIVPISAAKLVPGVLIEAFEMEVGVSIGVTVGHGADF